MTAHVDILLARLEQVRRYGDGWRARCPSCGGRSRDKVSIAVSESGRVLVHCFSGCTAAEVIAAAGLQLGDLFPKRLAPESPEDRRRARLLARQAGWGAALECLEFEARIVLIAAADMAQGRALAPDDRARLEQAVERIADARSVLTDAPRYRPAREGVAG